MSFGLFDQFDQFDQLDQFDRPTQPQSEPEPGLQSETRTFSTLPRELIYEIAIRTNFEKLRLLCQTNSVFRSICQDPRFWQLKAEHDFGTSREIFDLLGVAGSGSVEPVWRPTPRTRYLEILSETDCTYESTELINLDTALICAAGRGDFELGAFIIALFNRKYQMPRLFDLSNRSIRENTLITCRSAADSLGRALERASYTDNLDMIKLLISSIIGFSTLPTGERSYDPHVIIARVMRGAAKVNHPDIVKYLTTHGIDQYPRGSDYGLEGAAEGHHLELIQSFWNRPTLERLDSPAVLALIGASRGGHMDLVDQFSAGLVPSQFMTPFIAAAESGSIPVLQYFIDHGIVDTSNFDDIAGRATLQAARLGQTAVLQFLYSQFPQYLSVLDVTEDLNAAASQGHQSSVMYLLSHHPRAGSIETAWISAASTNHLTVAELLHQVLKDYPLARSEYALTQKILEQSVENGSREGVQYALSLGASLTPENYALIQLAKSKRQYSMFHYLNWILSLHTQRGLK
jgi:hypothetical protein